MIANTACEKLDVIGKIENDFDRHQSYWWDRSKETIKVTSTPKVDL